MRPCVPPAESWLVKTVGEAPGKLSHTTDTQRPQTLHRLGEPALLSRIPFMREGRIQDASKTLVVLCIRNARCNPGRPRLMRFSQILQKQAVQQIRLAAGLANALSQAAESCGMRVASAPA